jgi:hypothetical protein
LIHQIPPKPDYFRVKVARRLQRLGAVAIKNSVYALPRGEQAREDFEWLAREITEEGGDASVCEAEFVAGLSDERIEELFRAARDGDYAGIAEEAKEICASLPPEALAGSDARAQAGASAVRLRRRLGEAAAIDFFDAAGRQTAEGFVGDLEMRLKPMAGLPEKGAPVAGEFNERTWVTRKGPHIDRLASAWLVRRFADSRAKFKFVPARGYRPQAGEIRFDMFDAEFTHEGDRCTFEVMLRRFGLDDAALRAIAEIVHDVDLKDGKFGRAETPGIQRLIAGLCAAHKEDDVRLARGAALFDDLYESFARTGR